MNTSETSAYQFCIQLLGFVEVSNSKSPTMQQWGTIKQALDNVEISDSKRFSKDDPEGFVLWLRGYLAFSSSTSIGQNEWNAITERLQQVKLSDCNDKDNRMFKELEDLIRKQPSIPDTHIPPVDRPKRLEEQYPGYPPHIWCGDSKVKTGPLFEQHIEPMTGKPMSTSSVSSDKSKDYVMVNGAPHYYTPRHGGEY